MKRWITSVLLVLLVFSCAFTAFAGDIPESLLHSEDAQLFFGEVLSYHPNKERPDIEVSPVAAIKGDVQEGSKQIYEYPNAIGDFWIIPGKVYLFTYYEGDDSIDVFEVSSYNTKTLKLRHAEGGMWERFEQYLNEGRYGEAQVSGMLPYTVDLLIASAAVVFLVWCIVVVLSIHAKRNAMRRANTETGKI